MDLKASSGPLHRPLDDSLKEATDLIRAWQEKTPLLQYVIAPRFAISCTEKMMRAGIQLQKERRPVCFTRTPLKIGARSRSSKNAQASATSSYLDKLGALTERSVIAHGVHLSKIEVKKFVSRKAGLAHCPASNLKLASGIAPIPEYLKLGMKIGLGTERCPTCNNTHDPFLEMRFFADSFTKPKFGPRAMPAEEVLRLATLGGAESFGPNE